MSTEDQEALLAARKNLVEARRQTAQQIAKQYMQGQDKKFVRLQEAIEAIDRATQDEANSKLRRVRSS